MKGLTYITRDGEEIDFHDRALRISRARFQIDRLTELQRQANEELSAVEEELTALHLARPR